MVFILLMLCLIPLDTYHGEYYIDIIVWACVYERDVLVVSLYVEWLILNN